MILNKFVLLNFYKWQIYLDSYKSFKSLKLKNFYRFVQ